MKNTVSRQMPIGEFARLCGTTIQTLRIYDQKDLLKPSFVGEQNYRYYDPMQVYAFHTISYMKRCGCNLRDIRAYLRAGVSDEENYLFYQNTENALQKEIDILQSTIRQVKATQFFFRWLSGMNLREEPALTEISGDIWCASTAISPHAAINTEAFSVGVARHLGRFRYDLEYPVYPMAIVVATEGTTLRRFMVSHVICLPFPDEKTGYETAASAAPDANRTYHIGAGQYLAARYDGPSRVPMKSLLQMYRFIREHNLRVRGDTLVIFAISGIDEANVTQYTCAILMRVEA